MRRRLIVLSLAAAAVLAAPATALASPPASKLLLIQQGSPMAGVQSNDTVPLHFTSSAGQAIAAAEHSPTLVALHRHMHPLFVIPYVWRSQQPYWYVVFWYRGKIVADADVSRSGKVTGAWTGVQALAPYTHGGWATVLTTPWILVPASLLFMLAFFDPRRLWRIAHLDALAVLALLGSYIVLSQGHMESAIWLVYPPLLYLLIRLLRVGFARGKPAQRLAPLLSTRTLMIGLPLLLIARVALSLISHEEIDIGYESVIGAFRVLHHLPMYYNDANHGDTYGPFTYLAYVPFELVFPWKNSLSDLHAADAASIFFDLGTVGALVLLGRRLRTGAEGMRLGLLLGWAWAACPFTIVGILVHTNDGLVAMLTVLMLVLLRSPVFSGALLGLATAAKFSPAGLLPLLAAPRERGVKRALICVGAFAVIVITAIFSWLPPQGLGYLWHRTIGFQMTRPDPFSPWGLHPALHPFQIALEVLAIGLAALVAFTPRERSLSRVCALAGAVTIAVQLPAEHWFYYYIMWFLPFALVAFLVPPGAPRKSEETPAARELERLSPTEHASEPALAGV
jgi:glycosyl transferase family 87